MLPQRMSVVDVGPRDGLKNEPRPVAAADKIELVARLQRCGLREIEVASFVSPKWVPRPAGVRLSVLVPNLKGLQAALARPRSQWPDEVVVFGAASKAFSQRNINCSIDESMARFAPVVAAAREAGLEVRGAISCALGCPYEGEVHPDRVEHVVRAMRDIGVTSACSTSAWPTPPASARRSACRPRWSAR